MCCKFTMITMITMMVMMIMGSAVWRIASPNWRRYRISPCDSKFDHFHDNRRHANRPLISFVITCHVPSPTWQETTVRRLISLWINLAECVMETSRAWQFIWLSVILKDGIGIGGVRPSFILSVPSCVTRYPSILAVRQHLIIQFILITRFSYRQYCIAFVVVKDNIDLILYDTLIRLPFQ